VAVNRPCKKGESGNPGGRPKDTENLRELARARTAEAVETLDAIMKNKRAPASARVSAACALLDRGFGKPVQALVGKEGEPPLIPTPVPLTSIELARELAYLLRAAAEHPNEPVEALPEILAPSARAAGDGDL